MNRELKELEKKIGYRFQKFALLKKAMVHSSYANEMHLPKYNCNERLEFLGDAVLELISSEFLFFDESRMQEGDLTKLRASMVCEPALAFCARQLNLGEYLLLGKGEEATGGRKRESVVSDAVQANFKEGLQYRLIDEKGPDHNKSFSSAVYIGEKRYGTGEGKTKKAAEQEAAYQSILMLREKNIK